MGTPFGMITTVQSNVYPVEVEAIKKIFFTAQQALLHVLATAPAVSLLRLPADVDKTGVAKDGINKSKLFHICAKINHEITSFDNLTFATFSKGADLVMDQPWAG